MRIQWIKILILFLCIIVPITYINMQIDNFWFGFFAGALGGIATFEISKARGWIS